jgi:hypothetical protein
MVLSTAWLGVYSPSKTICRLALFMALLEIRCRVAAINKNVASQRFEVV